VMRPIGDRVTGAAPHIRALRLLPGRGSPGRPRLDRREMKDFENKKGRRVFYNMAVPVAHARDASCKLPFSASIPPWLLQRKPASGRAPALVAPSSSTLRHCRSATDAEVTANR
jgi:hypothetical protein